jgi:hypothetical protein
VAKRDVPVSIRRGQRVRTRVEAPDEVDGPIDKGEPLGRVAVTVDGRVAGASPLVAAEPVDAASLLDKAREAVIQPLALIPAGLLVLVLGLVLALRGGRKDEDEPDEAEDAPAPEPPQQAVPPQAAAPQRARQAQPSQQGRAQPPQGQAQPPQGQAQLRPQPGPSQPPPPPRAPAPEPPDEDSTASRKGPRIRRRKSKGSQERTPEERRQMAELRAQRRRKGRGR